MTEKIKEYYIQCHPGREMEIVSGRPPAYDTLVRCMKDHVKLNEDEELRLDGEKDWNIVRVAKVRLEKEKLRFLGIGKPKIVGIETEEVTVVRHVAHYDPHVLFTCKIGCPSCMYYEWVIGYLER